MLTYSCLMHYINYLQADKRLGFQAGILHNKQTVYACAATCIGCSSMDGPPVMLSRQPLFIVLPPQPPPHPPQPPPHPPQQPLSTMFPHPPPQPPPHPAPQPPLSTMFPQPPPHPPQPPPHPLPQPPLLTIFPQPPPHPPPHPLPQPPLLTMFPQPPPHPLPQPPLLTIFPQPPLANLSLSTAALKTASSAINSVSFLEMFKNMKANMSPGNTNHASCTCQNKKNS
ncbi:hypothetical protein Hanom_Chr14g01300221 [Helianthus anomalus]